MQNSEDKINIPVVSFSYPILGRKITNMGVLRILLALDLFFSIYGGYALVSFIEFIMILIVTFDRGIRERIFKNLDISVKILLLFIICICISMFWGIAPVEDRIEDLVSWRKVVLFPLALFVFKNLEHRIQFFNFFICYIFLYAFLSWADFIWNIFPHMKPEELVENNVVQGVVFSLTTFVLINFMAKRLGFFGRHKILSLFVITLIASNIFVVSTSRSGYLVFIVCMVLAGLFFFRRFSIILTMATTSLFSGIFLLSERPSNEISEAIHEIQTYSHPESDKTSIGMRLVLWENTWTMIQDRPVFGTGSGSFRPQYAEVVAEVHGWRGEVSDDPHNQYLHLWAEYGITTLLVFSLFLAACGTRVGNEGTGLVGLAILVGISASSLFSGHFASFVEGRIFWLGLGVALAGCHFRGTKSKANINRFFPSFLRGGMTG